MSQEEKKQTAPETEAAAEKPEAPAQEAPEKEAPQAEEKHEGEGKHDCKHHHHETAALQAKLEAEEKKNADLKNQLLRTAAEYDNYRKRSQREREQAYTDAVSRAVTALLPTYDNLERALKAETADTEYKKGVELTMTQLTESLKGINVTVIDATAGTAFDPNFHNAVMHVEDENLGENVIAETFQQGFQIGDKVIRHAMVKVAN